MTQVLPNLHCLCSNPTPVRINPMLIKTNPAVISALPARMWRWLFTFLTAQTGSHGQSVVDSGLAPMPSFYVDRADRSSYVKKHHLKASEPHLFQCFQSG